MAVVKSPEWPMAYNNANRRNPISIFHRSLPFISILCLNSRTLVAKSSESSSCSSPVLKAAANSQPIQLDLKLEGLESTSLPEKEDLNDVICTLFQNGQNHELAYDYYHKARQEQGFRPKKLVLKLVIRYLIRSRKWDSLFSLCEDFRFFKVLPDGSTCFRLISSCIRARKFRLVNSLLEIFSSDPSIAFLAFDSAMKGYNKLHMYSSTISVYQRMKSADIVLDTGCYCHIMDAYLKMGKYDVVIELFDEFEMKRMGSDLFVSKIYWNLCESLGNLGRPFEALEKFREMMKKDVPENHSFYSSLICSFLSIKELGVVEELLHEAEKKNMLGDPSLFLKLVLLYSEEGMMEKTLDIVALMDRVEIKVSDCIFCAIVNGFVRKRGLRSAIKVYEHLILQGCEPGQVTYASVLNIYCRLGLYSQAESIFSEMEGRGFDRCVVAYSSMVAMYGKTSRPNDAMKLVARMKERGCEPNVWVYNSLLDMHGRTLNLRQVEKTWKEMNRRKIWPDKVSYTSVISAYSRAREYDMCMKCYREFRLNGGSVDRAMAGIMVAVFSKMNQVDELVKLLQDMKAEGTKLDVRLYKSSLNALRDAGMSVQVKWLQENYHATTQGSQFTVEKQDGSVRRSE